MRRFDPPTVQVELADGIEFDLEHASEVTLEAGTIKITYSRTAAESAGTPRIVFLSSSEWRRLVASAPEGMPERAEKALDDLITALENAEAAVLSPTVIAALRKAMTT